MEKLFKHILTAAVFLIILPAATRAQDASPELRSMAAAVKSLGDYTVTFRLAAEGNVLAGEYTVSGTRYALNVADTEVYSDGRIRYEINHADDEILIDNVDPVSRDILTNPTRAFDFADDDFSASGGGSRTVDGKNCNLIYLTPKNRDSSIKNIELLVDRTTKLPVSISYAAEGLTGYVIVEILKMSAVSAVPASLFSPDLSLFKGYEVIDFR